MSSRSEALGNLAEGEIVDIQTLKRSPRIAAASKKRANALLRDSLVAAMKQLKRYARLVNVNPEGTNINESVLRVLVLAEIMRRDRRARCQTEWKKFDLLVAAADATVLVEFKFYGYNRMYGLDGKPGQWKGGASPQNEREFQRCVNKLKEFRDDRIAGKYLVLVYQNGPWRGNRGNHKHSFEESYANLTRFAVTRVEKIGHSLEEDTTCKLLEVD